MADVSLNLHLHPAQMEVFVSPSRFNVIAAGRRFGKSDLAVKRAITKALDPANVRRKPVWIVAPVQPQAKQIYWGALFDVLGTRDTSPTGLIIHSNVNEGLITLENKVQIGVKGADRPDTMRGVGLYDVTLDEFADMKPETWETILRPALSDVEGSALFIGTPKGRNHFYQLYMEAADLPDWSQFHFTTYDNPYIKREEIEAAKKTMSSGAFRQEYLASFETGGSDLFNREHIKYSDVEPKEGDWYVTADLAGFASAANTSNVRLRRLDETAISVVKISGEDDWWVRDVYIGRWGVEETAKRIVEAVESVKALEVGIEKGALYNAVAPYLTSMAARKKMPLRVEAMSHENRAKADRITWALQGRFEHGKITFRSAGWNKFVEDQLINFPSKLVHDDALDSLAYVAQLAEGRIFQNFGEVNEKSYFVPMDSDIGV